MAEARRADRIVLTHDLDFGAILAATQGTKPSVVQIRADDTSPETIGPSVLAGLRQLAGELEAGALVTIEPGQSRVRLLPLPYRSDTT
jgi:predicted nuclease of predicted toxin-antitoxin system